MSKKFFSIVIPIYKNELNLPTTIPFIIESIQTKFSNYEVELVLVNDGSPDCSYEIMKKYQNMYPKTIKIASFTRNFGQVSAINYGISISAGDAIGVISADMQDPLELFVDMLTCWEQGTKLVIATRKSRMEKGLTNALGVFTHFIVNRFIDSKYPVGGFDFFLMDKEVAKQYIGVSERNGSPQLLLLWLGFEHKEIQYERKERLQGKSSWSVAKKFKLVIDIFTTNSYLPLRFMSIGGLVFSIFAFIYVIVIFMSAIFIGSPVQGWPSLAALVTFFSGLTLMSLGIIGEYLWRIFDYVKNRPFYIVKETIDETNNKKIS